MGGPAAATSTPPRRATSRGSARFPRPLPCHVGRLRPRRDAAERMPGSCSTNLILAAGKLRPMVVVMPMGHTGPFQLQGVPSPETRMEEFEDFASSLHFGWVDFTASPWWAPPTHLPRAPRWAGPRATPNTRDGTPRRLHGYIRSSAPASSGIDGRGCIRQAAGRRREEGTATPWAAPRRRRPPTRLVRDEQDGFRPGGLWPPSRCSRRTLRERDVPGVEGLDQLAKTTWSPRCYLPRRCPPPRSAACADRRRCADREFDTQVSEEA